GEADVGSDFASLDAALTERELIRQDGHARRRAKLLERRPTRAPAGREHAVLNQEEGDFVAATREIRGEGVEVAGVGVLVGVTRFDQEITGHCGSSFSVRYRQESGSRRPSARELASGAA